MEKRVILVVQDDETERTALEAALRKVGFDVDTASDGLKALTLIEKRCPDLILTDVVLPNLDGMRLLKAIKGRKETMGIPVVMLTAKSDTSSMVEGISSGARFYVLKPYDMNDLVRKLKRALGESTGH